MATVYTDIFYHYEWCCNVIVGWIHISDSLALGSCDKAFVHDQNITETIVTFHTMSRKQSNWRNVTSSSSWLKVSWQTRCRQTTDRWQLLIDNRQCLEGYNTIKILWNITNYENATAKRFHSFWLRITSNNIFTLKPQCGHYTGNQEYTTAKKRVFWFSSHHNKHECVRLQYTDRNVGQGSSKTAYVCCLGLNDDFNHFLYKLIFLTVCIILWQLRNC